MAKTFRKQQSNEIKYSDRKKYFAQGMQVKKPVAVKTQPKTINRTAARPDKYVRS